MNTSKSSWPAQGKALREPYHPFISAEAEKRYLRRYDAMAEKWPVPSEPRMVDTSYGQTFVRVSGPIEAPPLVLLPGASTSSLMWASNIAPWSERFRTYAVDNIYDYGRSVYSRPMRNRDVFTSWLDELFDALNLGTRINLIGMSYGGWLAGEYALRFQERLAKVVLVAPAATILSMRWGFMIRAIGMYVMRSRYCTGAFMRWVFRGLAEGDAKSRRVLDNMVEDAYLASHCFKMHGVVRPRVFGDKTLQEIRAPLLFMVGNREEIYSSSKAVARLKKVAPHIRTEVIPDAGHGLTLEQAEMVNRIVLEFLTRT